jgi:hypothetical protein
MDDKRITEILTGIVRTDKEVHFNSTTYDIDSYAEIFKQANTTRPVLNSLNVTEALLIMLQVVHSFKYSIDMYNEHADANDLDDTNGEIEKIINNRALEINEKPFRITPGNLTSLLVEVLYEINGAHYRINDPDYMWEEELDEILKLPNWSYGLDSEITKFLLLPLYYATHKHQEKNDERFS